ncbi:hypothetical protein [Paenibacillus oceani]|uniref:Uncharacterized protein n=1 Tax=Paenibacillus oceani TaxID=2772510 RepID=A0A927H295_9BACL|nr:hypothetical protein [Paenibacillus oceani]MBD2864259.1 hypothetical protein [Paenibacillus oceani]
MKKQKTNNLNGLSVSNVVLRFFEPNFEPDDLEKKDLNLHITMEVEVLSFGKAPLISTCWWGPHSFAEFIRLELLDPNPDDVPDVASCPWMLLSI